MRVICIPYNDRELYSSFYKIKYAGPKEFLYYIKNASLIITDSFHATAFALNFNVPFYTLLRNELTEECNMNSRVIDILSFVNLEERLIKSEDDFPNEINMKIDFTNANRIIEDKRRNDIKFLKECIG